MSENNVNILYVGKSRLQPPFPATIGADTQEERNGYVEQYCKAIMRCLKLRVSILLAAIISTIYSMLQLCKNLQIIQSLPLLITFILLLTLFNILALLSAR